jgi:hypothetical protein
VLGASYTVVDADFKNATTRSPQRYLCIGSMLADEIRRLTGARLIVSLPAVLDFDAHRLQSFLGGAVAGGGDPSSPRFRLKWFQMPSDVP